MFCIIAFIVLSILGIFSASNRLLAREALDCVFRRVTLRPCTTGFDEKMKARILGIVITRSETAARVLNRNFEVLSWAFFLLLMASSIWSMRGLYLFYTTGSCNGENSARFCVLDPTGENNQVSSTASCGIKPANSNDVTLNGIDLTDLPTLKGTSPEDWVVMIGCYHCDFSRKTYPIIRDLTTQFGSTFTYFNFPTAEDNDYYSRLSYCINRLAPDQYWAYNDLMFSGDKVQLDDGTHLNEWITDIGENPATVQACTKDPETIEVVKKQLAEIQKTNFYGTPTVFINGKAFIGPKPYRVYAIQLKGFFYWLLR